jgi:alpha-D-xyloside xylohydrolase
VGYPVAPPLWAFGLWMSSGFFRDTAEDVIKRADKLREYDIPADVLHLDCYWQRFGRWSENLWDAEMFPDPEGMLRAVKAKGYKVCLWINSYIGIESERFTEGAAKGYFLKNPHDETYVAPLWGRFHPPVGIIDVTNPAALTWFKDMLRPLLQQGVDVFKTDFGEGVPADARAHNGMSGLELHNLYALLYNDAVSEVTREVNGHGMVWGRSTYAGGQRHAAQWGGDPNCTYQGLANTIRAGLSMTMCGHAFWSHDIGGFHKQPTPDLFVRWAQFGMFSPLARAHGMTTRLPWEYGDEALRIFRQYAKLRYSLLPYIYGIAKHAEKTGEPMMRPMVMGDLDDLGDPMAQGADLQYLFGRSFLVAPIYNPQGRRPVYFPVGGWIDYWRNTQIDGPFVALIDAPLDILPLYVRLGSLVPTRAITAFVGEQPPGPLVFDGFLAADTPEASYADDDLEVYAQAGGSRLAVRVVRAAEAPTFRFRPLYGMEGVTEATYNGSPARWARDADGTITVAGPIEG